MPPSKSESPGRKSQPQAEKSSEAAKQTSASSGEARRKRLGQKCEPSSSSANGKQTSRDGKETEDYVKFLSTKQRTVCDDGFIDSRRYRLVYGDKGEASPRRPKSVVEFTSKTIEEENQYEKRLRMIEELMWKHKQEARELHHESGNITKKQQAVRRTLQDYENTINQKRLEEDRKLNEELSKYTSLQQTHEHTKQELGRQRLESDQKEVKEFKDKDHKAQKTTTELARRYETKMAALELKHAEIDTLNKEHTAKMQARELEQYRLKQELAELAIAINMEAQKAQEQEMQHENFHEQGSLRKEQKGQKATLPELLGSSGSSLPPLWRRLNDQYRQMKATQQKNKRVEEDLKAKSNLQTKLSHSTNDVKDAELTRRRLSLDLVTGTSRLEAKHREETRRKIDTERRMRENKEKQLRLQEIARATQADINTHRLNKRIQEHDKRKQEVHSKLLRERQEKKETSAAIYSEKFERRHLEETRRKHEDHLDHFQRAVIKGEQLENELYKKLKDAEQASQQLEQTVRTSELRLTETRRSNAARIKEEMMEMAKQESELEQVLLRERAALNKAHACRDESFQELQRHRERLRRDRYLLNEHEREHERLTRVGQRSDAASARD